MEIYLSTGSSLRKATASALLKGSRKTVGLGLDPQTVDRGLGPVSCTNGTPPNSIHLLLKTPTDLLVGNSRWESKDFRPKIIISQSTTACPQTVASVSSVGTGTAETQCCSIPRHANSWQIGQFVVDDASFQHLRTDLGCNGRL
jgi:hypothetical protein